MNARRINPLIVLIDFIFLGYLLYCFVQDMCQRKEIDRADRIC